MKLTPENKAYIDSLSLHSLLHTWRFAPIGSPWMADETGEYWGQRIAELRALHPNDYVLVSKDIGWGD